jgi:DNA-binding transcriptional ArsR family regulator
LQLIVNKEISYVEEANILLFNYVNHVSYEKMKAEGSRKENIDKVLYEKKFDNIIKINNYVIEHMRFEKEELEFYFKEFGNSQLSLSYYLLPLFSIVGYKTINDYKEAAKKKNDKEVLEDFDFILSENYCLGKQQEGKVIDTFEEMTRLLDKGTLPFEDKWKIIKAYLNREQYLEELCLILEKIVLLMKECQGIITDLENEFIDYWSAYTEKADFLIQLQKHVNMVWDYSNKETFITPALFKPQSIQFNIQDDGEKVADVIRIGIVLNSELTLRNPKVDLAGISNALKLLSDKSKFEILKFIKDKPAYGFEIANALNLSTSTISYHMNSLISERLVKMEKDATKIYYRVNRETIENLLAAIKDILL